MQIGPFTTSEEAKKMAKEYKEKYDTVYARPNPDEVKGGYVVIYHNTPWWHKPLWGGCPHVR